MSAAAVDAWIGWRSE